MKHRGAATWCVRPWAYFALYIYTRVGLSCMGTNRRPKTINQPTEKAAHPPIYNLTVVLEIYVSSLTSNLYSVLVGSSAKKMVDSSS